MKRLCITRFELTKQISSSDGPGSAISVFSTLGWKKTGKLLIGNELFQFNDKNITQFTILTRQNNTVHPVGTEVYEPIELIGAGVTLLGFGLVYNLEVIDGQPNSYTGDRVEISDPGFSTADPKITNISNNTIRWKLSTSVQVSNPGYASIQQRLSGLATDVSAIFEDDQYYYVAGSGYPSYPILDGALNAPLNAADQKLLKLIRKQATRTTEIYETPKTDVGILVNGTRLYGYKDPDFVDFGVLQQIKVFHKTYKHFVEKLVVGRH